MRKLFTILLTLSLGLMMMSSVFAQTRYLEQMTTDITRTDTVPYASNIWVITGAPLEIPLIMDIYAPTTDSITNRPLVIIAHTGNFLPAVRNGSPNGGIKDSSVVEIAVRLAKMGYVVASIDYRQGWDVLNPDQTVQAKTLLQAAYRGIQDGRSAIRYFRRSVAENGNPFGIDPDKIVFGGIGTGGYVAMGVGYLQDYAKDMLLPKFLDPVTALPFIDTTLHGNPYGTSDTTVLNLPNHKGYSSEVSMIYHLGGAAGDSIWVDAGDPPCVSFHTPKDPLAPYDIGVVIVPTTGNTVIDKAAGGFAVTRRNNIHGNNDIFVNKAISDVWTDAASRVNQGEAGLFPFDKSFTPGPYTCVAFPGAPLQLAPTSAPWNWWNEAAFIAAWDALGGSPPGVIVNCSQLSSNTDMSATKARTYMDSVIGYLAPRMYYAMELDKPTAIDPLRVQTELKLFPNPADDMLRITSSQNAPILSIDVMDAMGRIVRTVNTKRSSSVVLRRNDLVTGMYFVRARFAEGSVTTRVVFK